MLRVFYLFELANFLKIDEFVHFDNDVMLYKSFSEINNVMINGKLNITPLTSDFLVFGYSYMNDLNIYDEICENVFNIYNSPKNMKKIITKEIK